MGRGVPVNFFGHLSTINHHKWLVMQHCFKVGLYRQGLLHDLSKYSPVEFLAGVKYYQGFESPNNAERRAIGYSRAWLHHKGRNKHHLEYLTDYVVDGTHRYAGIKMPVNYVAEMLCDRIAASKTYLKGQYTDAAAYDYYMHARDVYLIHSETRALLEQWLRMLRDEGEEKTFAHVRQYLKAHKSEWVR